MKDLSGMTDEQREDHWKAEGDARTLADALMIKNDPERLKKATDMASEIAAEKVEEARSMSEVGNALFDKNKGEDN